MAKEILSLDINGKLIVGCSTVQPKTKESLVDTIAAHGTAFVACPVFGAPAMAEAGQLICVLADPAEHVARVKPYTTGVIGRATIDFSGQPAGTTTLLKVIKKTFMLNMLQSLSEGHVLAEKFGLSADNLHSFIETMFPSPYTASSNRMLSDDYYKRDEPLFVVDLAKKDAPHALDLAGVVGAKMKDVEVAYGHLQDVREKMGGKGDLVGIYGAVRRESGLLFEIGRCRIFSICR